MLYAIKGKVSGGEPGKLYIGTGPFIFEVLVPQSYSPKTGSDITLFTSLFIREENMVLFGFPSEPQKRFFQLVLTVPGVGPKLGMALLGAMPLSELARHLQTSNTKALEKVSGVGKKLAQRLVGDLKDKVDGYVGASEPGSSKGEAVAVLVDLGLESAHAWEAVESVHRMHHSVSDLVDLSLKKLGKS